MKRTASSKLGLLLGILVTLGLAISLQGVLGINIGSVLNLGGNKITNVGVPTAPKDVATKEYSDSIAVSAHGKQMFTSSSTFSVPAGVTQVWITAVGGGGGGGGGAGFATEGRDGSPGGSSCFGALCVNGGGLGFAGRSYGGAGGAPGNELSSYGEQGSSGSAGGRGGDNVYSGRSIIGTDYGYGQGRNGGSGASGNIIIRPGGGGGGGGGVLLWNQALVVGGIPVTVTVGNGGAGGAAGTGCCPINTAAAGASGATGFVLVEW